MPRVQALPATPGLVGPAPLAKAVAVRTMVALAFLAMIRAPVENPAPLVHAVILPEIAAAAATCKSAFH